MATDELAKAARAMERTQARFAREEARRLKEEQREFTRRAAEAEKAAARAEVEAFERELEMLTSSHKVRPPFFNWSAQRFSLPPHPPIFHAKNHLRETAETILLTREYGQLEERLSVAWSKDEQAYYESYSTYEERYGRWARLKSVAQKLHAGNASALAEAHAELQAQGFAQSDMTGMVMQPCDARRLYVALRVAGRDITPDEVKTLTQSGKVSLKPMPKNRAREIYEDHVCSRCLAVGRHLFATLPLAEIIVTAYAPTVSAISGNGTDVPIVSVHFTKDKFVALNFDELDPSDALQGFRHAGDVRASRRGEDFTPIRPLAFDTTGRIGSPADQVQSLATTIETLRAAFRKFQTKGRRTAVAVASNDQEQWHS